MDSYFFVKSGYKIQKILVDEIIYVESMGDYIRFYLEDKKVVALLSMARIIGFLPADRFIQIHRSYIINKEKINNGEKDGIYIRDGIIIVPKGHIVPDNFVL